MNPDPSALFARLDGDGDGRLSRAELHAAACSMGWHWHEAPLYALLDLMTVRAPITRRAFIDCLAEIRRDPLGPFGRVLRRAAHPDNPPEAFLAEDFRSPSRTSVPGADLDLRYHRLLGTLQTPAVDRANMALLVIDPQRSFTRGAWMRSLGPEGKRDVGPIRLAFENCAARLRAIGDRTAVMFTRCPFPPLSYGWDRRLDEILPDTQLYLIKPGNSVWFPPDNGFRQWLQRCMDGGIGTLVIAGCTANSCVRVSALETRARIRPGRLRVVVDLSLCGARRRNYLPDEARSGMSAVEAAVLQMRDEGVEVVRRLRWRRPPDPAGGKGQWEAR